MSYIILHRSRPETTEPQVVAIHKDHIIAVEACQSPASEIGCSTRIYLSRQVSKKRFWTVAEDEDTVLRSLGFFGQQ